MNQQTYRKLSDQHFAHQLWRNDLAMAIQELTFFEDILGQFNPIGLSTSPEVPPFNDLVSQIHHFRRIIPQMQQELQQLEQELATDVQKKHQIGSETKKDHAYLQEKMDDFDQSYRQFKQKIRVFFSTSV